MVPDFCWPPPPDPPQVPPIPFPLFADLGGAKKVAKDVKINRKPAFVFKASKTNRTYGNELTQIFIHDENGTLIEIKKVYDNDEDVVYRIK